MILGVKRLVQFFCRHCGASERFMRSVIMAQRHGQAHTLAFSNAALYIESVSARMVDSVLKTAAYTLSKPFDLRLRHYRKRFLSVKFTNVPAVDGIRGKATGVFAEIFCNCVCRRFAGTISTNVALNYIVTFCNCVLPQIRVSIFMGVALNSIIRPQRKNSEENSSLFFLCSNAARTRLEPLQFLICRRCGRVRQNAESSVSTKSFISISCQVL